MAIRAHYEGANGNRMRSMLPGVIQNAKKDLSRATRRELLRNSRALWKNNPMVKAVVERLVTYVIGTGVRIEADSSDVAWNAKADAVFSQWAKYADLSSRQHAWKLQEIIFRGQLIDGDQLVIKTFGDSGRPRIQLIEGDQVGDQFALYSNNKNDDGVVCDKNGRPIDFLVQEDIGSGVKRERRIPADSAVLFANIERAGQQRGAPLAAAALTTAIDLHDILGLEKAAVKDGATKTDVIKTASGEVEGEGLVGEEKPSETSAEQVTKFYKEVFGPEAVVLRHGDEHTPYIPSRPSAAWAGFVDFLAELVCLSFNLPPSLVRQLKVGGADTRRDLAIMQRVVEMHQWAFAQNWQQIWEYVIESEINDGSLADAPPDWRKTDCQFPRAATVDAGRQAAADREDVRTGNMTLREMCGQYGTSWRTHIRQLATELRAVQDIEKEFGLPPGSLALRLYASQNAPSPLAPAAPVQNRSAA